MEKYFASHKKIVILLFLLILSTGAFFRLYNLTQVPAGFSQDEAVLGYDMYSIMLTGKDHHGIPIPITLQSFNDWVSHQSLFFFFYTPFIKIFGLTPFAIRLPLALFAVAQLPLFYFLGRMLTDNYSCSLLLMGIASQSYFGIMNRYLHRGYSVFFPLLALLVFFSAVKNNRLLLCILSGILFGISLYTYPSIEGSIPIFLVLSFIYLVIINSQKQRKIMLKKFFFLFLVFIPLSFPLFHDQLTNPQRITSRLSMVSIFTHSPLPLVSYVYNYFSYFAPKPLFIPGEVNPIRTLPGFGYENSVLSIFFYLGLFFLVFKRKSITHIFPFFTGQKLSLLFLFLITIPVIPSLTFPAGDFERAPHFFILLMLLVTVGISISFKFLTHVFQKDNSFWRLIIIFAITLFYLYGQIRFITFYFGSRYEEITQWYFQNGMENVVSYVKQNESKYENIIVDNVINQPYIYFLFYGKVNPYTLNYKDISVVNLQTNWLSVEKLFNYRFQPIPLEELKNAKEVTRIYNSPVSDYVFYEKDKTLFIKLQMTTSQEQFYRLVPILY